MKKSIGKLMVGIATIVCLLLFTGGCSKEPEIIGYIEPILNIQLDPEKGYVGKPSPYYLFSGNVAYELTIDENCKIIGINDGKVPVGRDTMYKVRGKVQDTTDFYSGSNFKIHIKKILVTYFECIKSGK